MLFIRTLSTLRGAGVGLTVVQMVVAVVAVAMVAVAMVSTVEKNSRFFKQNFHLRVVHNGRVTT